MQRFMNKGVDLMVMYNGEEKLIMSNNRELFSHGLVYLEDRIAFNIKVMFPNPNVLQLVSR